jgi:hypothetical protein
MIIGVKKVCSKIVWDACLITLIQTASILKKLPLKMLGSVSTGNHKLGFVLLMF